MRAPCPAGGPRDDSGPPTIGPEPVRITSVLQENVHEAHPGVRARRRLRLRSPRRDDSLLAGSIHHQPGRKAETIAAARANAQDHAGVGTGQGLVVRDTVRDANGASHVRFDRTYRGLPVVGGDLVVHQARNDAFRSVSGRALAPFQLPAHASVTARTATAKAAAVVHLAKEHATHDLVVLAVDRAPTLAWRVDVTGRAADGSPSGEYVFVGARNGRVLDRWASTEEATGSGTGVVDGTVSLETTLSNGQYTLVDGARGGHKTYNGPRPPPRPRSSPTPTTSGATAPPRTRRPPASTPTTAAATWDFYKNTFGRNGITNDGEGAYSRVHYGSNYVNAFWDDACFCMTYGDGDEQRRTR